MNDASAPEQALEWPHAPLLERDSALAALEEAWRMGDLAEHEPTT